MKLLEVIKTGNDEALRDLIEKGANVNRILKNGEHPLICAIKQGQEGIATILIQNGADVDAFVHQGGVHLGKTPLYLAVENGKVELARLLIEKGCDFDYPSHDGTALYCAQQIRHADLIKLLKDAGAF